METWMVDYENGDDEPQHAVLSWLDDEANELPEVGTQLVQLEDADKLRQALQQIFDEGRRPYTGMTQLGGTPKAELRERGQRMLNIATDALSEWSGE